MGPSVTNGSGGRGGRMTIESVRGRSGQAVAMAAPSHRRSVAWRAVGASVAAAALVLTVAAPHAFAGQNELAPKGRVFDINPKKEAKGAGAKATKTTSGISFHGGRVMTSGAVTVVPIWYGTGWSDTKKALVAGFLANLGGSGYYNINSTYTDAAHVAVPNLPISVNPGVDMTNYPFGRSVSDAGVEAAVQLAARTAGVAGPTVQYAFLGDDTTTLSSGYATQYCGWHTYTNVGTANVTYLATIDTPSWAMNACSVQSTSPNGYAGTDAMLSVLAHEVVESVTDPNLNAWYDTRGYENADKCAWTFGSTSLATNGSRYNVTLGGKQYLIQQNWVNASGGRCAMSYS